MAISTVFLRKWIACSEAVPRVFRSSIPGTEIPCSRPSIHHCINPVGKARAPEPDAELIKVVRDAQRWFDQIVKGRVTTVKEIAEAEGLDAGDVSRFLPLAFLAPDIVEKIIDGEQPIDLNAEKLKRLPLLPKAWIEQRDVMNFGRQK